MIDAQKAANYGLVNDVVELASLIETCKTIASKIARNSPTAIGFAIEAINAGFDDKTGFNAEVELFGKAFGTNDFKEGTTAFLEKRKPEFTGS